jgi:membrane fusion protein (multidrug efflux system)
MNVCKYRIVEVVLCGAVLSLFSACKPTEQPAQPPLTAAVMTAQVTPLPQEVEVSGQVDGTREVEVRARVTGILLTQSYREGEFVKAGELLFKIDPAPYEIALSLAKAQFAQEQARAEQATTEAKRQAALLAQNAASAKEAGDAQLLADSANAAKEVAGAKVKSAELDLSYCEVRAPIDGYAGRLQRSEGSLVTPGADGLLTTLVQRDKVWVRFGISEQEFTRVFAGDAAIANQAKVTVILPNGVRSSELGKINFVSAQVDPRLGTIQMRAEFDNTKNTLIPGQFVRVDLLGQTITSAVTVPASCLMQSSQGRFVYILNAEGKAQVAPIQIAQIHAGDAIVSAGLKAGDRVIIDNVQKIRPGNPVQVRGNPPANK